MPILKVTSRMRILVSSSGGKMNSLFYMALEGCGVLPLEGVARQWNVKKHASRSFNVGPVGILYMGYLQSQREDETSNV